MKEFNVAYQKLSTTVKQYIARNKDDFWKTHSLFSTAGVVRAKELLQELEAVKVNPFATVYDLITTVGQDKYNTGVELISYLRNDVLIISDTKPSTLRKLSRDIAAELNAMPIYPNHRRAQMIVREYRSNDIDVKALAEQREFHRQVENSRAITSSRSEYQRSLDAML